MGINLSKPLTLWNLAIGLFLTIAGGAFTAGIAWSGVVTESARVKEKVDQINQQRNDDVKNAVSDRDKLKQDVTDIKWVVIKIAQKSGVDTTRIEH